jgi:hypothetical protein
MGALVLVAGSIASNYQNGGIAWERLCWTLGLRRLGLDVVMVDQLDLARCVYPAGTEPSYENCLNRGYFESIVDQFGLKGSAALVGEGGESLFGPTYSELLERAGDAVMLVNVAGNLRLNEVKRRPHLRVYVDVDPGLTQLALSSGEAGARVAGHDLHFTIGENIGEPGCSLPTGGLDWRHTRQPVLLQEWPVSTAGDRGRFTTVGTWRGVGPHGGPGSELTQKADEVAKLIELPSLAPGSFELALKMRPDDAADRDLLGRHGWRVVDASGVASDPDAFRSYVQGSGAEFSVAKGAYVETWSGWFSDRTTRYLASGKPALVQDTGFSRSIDVGDGLLAFRTLADASAGAKRIAEDYEGHSRAAREVASAHFDSDKVLSRFVEDVGAPV